MISINDFFEIDKNNVPIERPINRIAYSNADVEYKIKCIKAMQDLGMEVTIDKIGNICGTIPGKNFTDKSVICGSHTDSVSDGGQFDGPLGVYAALKTAERIVNSNKQNSVNYKVVIYACEESTRFKGKACIGSKYLRGDNLDFKKTISTDGFSLEDLVKTYKKELYNALEKNNCKPITEVDKVLENDEIITALEGHIEQADTLRENNNHIGLCTSITAPYRAKVDITDIETAADFICSLNESARNPENLSKYRVTIPEFSIKNSSDLKILEGKQTVTIRFVGENNHSGATPMDRRKDAVYGAAKFIQSLSNSSDAILLQTCTPKWGPNQITGCCEVKFAIDQNTSQKDLLNLLTQQTPIKNSDIQYQIIDDISKSDKENGLFLDIRQQIGMNPKLSGEMVFETMKDIVHRTHCNAYMKITATGTPYETSPDLIESAESICKDKGISYEVTRSWAGHDLATLPTMNGSRTLLIFCDNSGGSHTPNETTTIESVNKLVDVESELTIQELDRADRLYIQDSHDSINKQSSGVEK